MSLWGRNTNMPASYIIQQNQNRAVYTDFMMQQQKITQGCQKTNRIANVTSVNSNQIVESVKENEQDQPCNEDMKCCISGIVCPVPEEQPYVAGPGQALWANMITVGQIDSTLSGEITAVTTDSQGNVYVCGYIQTSSPSANFSYPIKDYITTSSGEIILNNSPTVDPLTFTLTGGFLTYLVKYNKDGIAQWAVNFDNTANSLSQAGSQVNASIVTDDADNVYLITTFVPSSTLTIKHMDYSTTPPSRSVYGTIASTGSTFSDIIIIKYNANGTAQYISRCQSIGTESIRFQNVAISTYDGILAYTFFTNQTVTIFGGSQPATPGGAITFAGGSTISAQSPGVNFVTLVRAQTSNLNILQATRISSTFTCNNGSVTITNNQDIIVTMFLSPSAAYSINIYDNILNIGSPTAWAQFTGANTTNTNTYIIKYNNTLTPIAFAAVESTNVASIASADVASGNIVVDTLGNIYCAFQSRNTITPDIIVLRSFLSFTGAVSPRTINTSLYSSIPLQRAMGILIKYNSNLVIDSATTIMRVGTGSINPDLTSFGLSIDSNNNIYWGVNFSPDTFLINSYLSPPDNASSPVNVTPYASITNVTPIATSIFNSLLIKYNSNLQVQWATTLTAGVNINVLGLGLYYDSIDDSVYVAGRFINYSGYMNINNFNGVSGGNLILDLYATLIPTAIANSTTQISGFLVKYRAS